MSDTGGNTVTTTGAALGLPRYGSLELVDDPGDIGTLYETVDVVHHRRILVRIGRGSDVEALQRAFEAWRDLGTHPNIVTVFNLHMSDDRSTVALEMERHAASLEDRLEANGPLPFVQVLALGHGLVSGLVELHRSGQVHGSINAANVHLSSDDRPQIANIGFAGVEAPGTAAFESDVRAVADVLARALGATVSSRGQLASTSGPKPVLDGPDELDDVPQDVRDLIATTAVGSGVVTAEALRSSLTTRCRLWIGHVPENISARSQIVSGELHLRQRDSDATGSGSSATRDPEVVGAREDHTHSGAPSVAVGSDAGDRSQEARAGADGGSRGESWVSAAADTHDADDDGSVSAPDRGEERRWVKPAAVLAAATCAFLVAFLLQTDVFRSSAPTTTLERPTTTTTAVETTTSSVEQISVTPDAPSNVEAVFTNPGEVRLSWTNNSGVVQGFAVRIVIHSIGIDGQRVPEPTFDGWIDADGRKSLTEELVFLPADTTSVSLQIEDLNSETCLRPAAIAVVRTGGGTDPDTASVSNETECVPSAPPAAPTVVYSGVEDRPAGVNRIEWVDQSFDEHSFVVLSIDPETTLVVDAPSAPANATSWPVTLRPGSTTCYVVRAVNAQNLDRTPQGKPVTPTASDSEPFCFRAA